MTSTAFRNLRALIQLFSILLILVTIPLIPLLFVNYDIVAIETKHIEMGLFSLTNIYKVAVIGNLTLGLFASCGSNSKVKLYMRLYQMCAFLYLMVYLACILYVKNRYAIQLHNNFIDRAVNNINTRLLLASTLNCQMTDNTCKKALDDASKPLIRYFLWISSVSFILHILSFICIKFACNIAIEKPEAKPPKFVSITKAGMDTQSLRQKRIIEVAQTPSGITS